MFPELVVAGVVVSFDRRLLEGPVHSFDNAANSPVVGLGGPVFDIVLPADLTEAVDAAHGGWAAAVLRQLGKLDAPSGQARGQAAISVSRKAQAMARSARSCS